MRVFDRVNIIILFLSEPDLTSIAHPFHTMSQRPTRAFIGGKYVQSTLKCNKQWRGKRRRLLLNYSLFVCIGDVIEKSVWYRNLYTTEKSSCPSYYNISNHVTSQIVITPHDNVISLLLNASQIGTSTHTKESTQGADTVSAIEEEKKVVIGVEKELIIEVAVEAVTKDL